VSGGAHSCHHSQTSHIPYLRLTLVSSLLAALIVVHGHGTQPATLLVTAPVQLLWHPNPSPGGLGAAHAAAARGRCVGTGYCRQL